MKYFGTDGIRGKYGEKLDASLAYKTGKALCQYFGKGDYVVDIDRGFAEKYWEIFGEVESEFED